MHGKRLLIKIFLATWLNLRGSCKGKCYKIYRAVPLPKTSYEVDTFLHEFYVNNMEKGKNPMLGEHDQIDRSKIKILLCDVNAESCQEVLALLCKCSYQVAAVWSAIEVFDTLNSQGPHADIILAAVDLLMANDANILRYIMRKKDLRHIPVVILTTRDQVSVTVKGLRLGAADYLVKPLLEDELSNLWMHSLKFHGLHFS